MDSHIVTVHQLPGIYTRHPNGSLVAGHRESPLEAGHEGFMIFGSSVLWLLVPGCGFFYSGMARHKSALSMIVLSLWSVTVASIQWYMFGYSLAFSLTSGNSFIGDFSKVFYMGVSDAAYPTAKRFCFYQGVTSTLPASLIAGALAERARVLPSLLFIFFWLTFVYCPVAFWSLNPNGWSYKLGVLDFGGGAPVHVPAAAAALAYSYVLGPRSKAARDAKPHNMLSLGVGTVLIWFGSFGYNSGSAFGATLQAVFASTITNLSGAVGALTWSLLDYIKEGKLTGFGFCAGAVVGLIVITPSSGFVNPACAFPIAITGSALCRWGHIVKEKWKYDDALDVFAMHGLAGIVGVLSTGIFAQKVYAGDDIKKGGWLDGNWFQIVDQIADTVAGFSLSISVSYIILSVMNYIPGLKIRLDDDEIEEGMDNHELGISCYEHVDYIQLDETNSNIWENSRTISIPKLIHENGTNDDENVGGHMGLSDAGGTSITSATNQTKNEAETLSKSNQDLLSLNRKNVILDLEKHVDDKSPPEYDSVPPQLLRIPIPNNWKSYWQ